jgi:hypothetical protein
MVPVVTGIPFWIAAIILLALASPRTARATNSLERRLPHSWRHTLRRGIVKVPIRVLREAVNPSTDADDCHARVNPGRVE